MAVTARTALVPLFLVSLAAVGYETALTRYFAVAKWSEYGYWVISIVMVGFAFSGVLLALFRDAFARHGETLLAALPALLVATAAIGFHFTTINPFNPLQLQNPVTWEAQLWNIAGYYACLLPFFFLAGMFVSLSFVLNADRIGRVYGYDLTGAGTGAALVLAAMFVVHAFFLVPLLLIPLAASACFVAGRRRWAGAAAAGVALLGAEALLLLDNQAEFNDFKAIYAPLHTPDARVVASVLSPRGDYALLDDFTERVDTDISNNAGMLGVPGPPRTFGLYRDGNRIAALPKPGKLDVAYAPASLDALPYLLIPHANVLLAGASGGFRIAEVLALGAAHVRVLEPEPVLLRALEHGLGPSPAQVGDARVTVSGAGPVAAVRNGGDYDIIDLSADFLDAAEANATAFTVQAIAGDLLALRPGGIVSIPVSIRDFPVYALRVLGTARAALLAAGIDDPAAHVDGLSLGLERAHPAVKPALGRRAYRHAAPVLRRPLVRRVVVSGHGSGQPRAAVSTTTCQRFRSPTARSPPTVRTIRSPTKPARCWRTQPTPSRSAFNLAPITLDRPFFYAVLRLDQLDTMLQRLEILPQAEIGALVNLAVLAQAVVIAVLVLLVPLVAPRRLRLPEVGLLRPIIYFPALGLGFLFIEIFLIEKASLWLNDRTSGFALVLTGMLIFSGLGSMMADRLERARQGIIIAGIVIICWCGVALTGLQPAILATLDLPWIIRAGLVLAALAPVSLALGLPFPLGLSRIGSSAMLPWAWGLNGAFSVVATPLANLIAREAGFSRVLLSAAMLYVVALMAFPAARTDNAWQHLSARSRAAE